MFFYLGTLIEDICFLISLFCLANKKAGWYRIFIIYLFLVVTGENAGFYLGYHLHKVNYWIYVWYFPMETALIAWILHQFCSRYFNSKPLFIAGLAVVDAVWLAESIGSHFSEYSSVAHVVFSVWVVLMCFLYYHYLLKSEEDVVIYSHFPFLIVTGLFIFYLVSVPANLFFQYLAKINLEKTKPVRYVTFLVLSLILYGSWSYAFICFYRKKI